MDTCMICNKDFDRLGVHVRHKHQMSMEEYNTMMAESEGLTNQMTVGELPDVPEADASEESEQEVGKVKVEDVQTAIWGEREISEEMPLGEYCRRKNLAIDELNSLVNRYTHGSAIDKTRELEHNVKLGEQGAEELKDQDIVRTPNIHIAETLVKKLQTHDVETVKAGNPKIYVLRSKASKLRDVIENGNK